MIFTEKKTKRGTLHTYDKKRASPDRITRHAAPPSILHLRLICNHEEDTIRPTDARARCRFSPHDDRKPEVDNLFCGQPPLARKNGGNETCTCPLTRFK